MIVRHQRGLAAMLAALALLSSAAAADDAWRWTGVERIVAIGDVHGAAGPMVEVLEAAGVIDADETWSAGPAHLVVTGDFLDRGPESRLAMDLLMRLEHGAAAAGGRVHVLLGNHEAMNLIGDLRYVSEAEYAAFAKDESAGERERAYATFRASRSGAPAADEAALEREFAARAPPGFFAHRKAFSPDGHYGKWLLAKPLLVVINDTAFVHGGLSPLVTKLGLEGVNGELKRQLTEYARHLATLVEAGVLDPTEDVYRQAEVLRALPDDPGRPDEIGSAIEAARRLGDAAIHDLTSPLWYRGNVACSPLIEADKLDAALEKLEVRRVVVGHTPTPARRVSQRLDGRVVEIDTGMLRAAYGGRAQALIIDNGRLLVVGEDGDEGVPLPHPPQTTMLSHRNADPESLESVERALATGEILSSTEDERGWTTVEVAGSTSRLTARFYERDRDDVSPQLAAWRLDGLLGLDMVPVTVARTIDGEEGVLQLVPPAAGDEATRATSGEGAGAWCPLPEQWSAMYLFDALIGNEERTPYSMLYGRESWHLVLTDHGESFGTRGRRPRYLERMDLRPGAAWSAALSALSDERLQAALGDVLDERRLRALARRRDELLAGEWRRAEGE